MFTGRSLVTGRSCFVFSFQIRFTCYVGLSSYQALFSLRNRGLSYTLNSNSQTIVIERATVNIFCGS